MKKVSNGRGLLACFSTRSVWFKAMSLTRRWLYSEDNFSIEKSIPLLWMHSFLSDGASTREKYCWNKTPNRGPFQKRKNNYQLRNKLTDNSRLIKHSYLEDNVCARVRFSKATHANFPHDFPSLGWGDSDNNGRWKSRVCTVAKCFFALNVSSVVDNGYAVCRRWHKRPWRAFSFLLCAGIRGHVLLALIRIIWYKWLLIQASFARMIDYDGVDIESIAANVYWGCSMRSRQVENWLE